MFLLNKTVFSTQLLFPYGERNPTGGVWAVNGGYLSVHLRLQDKQ